MQDAVSIRAPPRTTGRSAVFRIDQRLDLFQSAPRRERRGDYHRLHARGIGGVSIRAPPRTTGRSANAVADNQWVIVSIRAPPRTTGRSFGATVAAQTSVFQSAPRRERRGDRSRTPWRFRTGRFNPRPAANDGAIADENTWINAALFQSAPRRERRGDFRSGLLDLPVIRFNPRPAANDGAIQAEAPEEQAQKVSIRAPPRTTGR